ncbi:MAG: GGDEF domain-containing protein, partial [Betaproteobacteria bacterium]
LARWGGEEFLLLMSDTRGSLARLGVERLRERAEAIRLVIGKAMLQITFSAGITEHRAGEPLSDTVARADQALYAAKAAGRNRVVLY